MCRSISRLLAFLPVLLLLACASGGGAREGARSNAPPSSTFLKNVGVVTLPDLDTKGRRILERHQFQIVRHDGPPDVYYETQWQQREPFDDERALGAVRAQSRILLKARQRNDTWAKAVAYTVDFYLENQVRHEGGDFTEVPATPQFTQYARRIASELEVEFRSGVRTF